MKPWKSITLAVIALVILGNWIATRPTTIPRAAPTASVEKLAPPTESPAIAESPAPQTASAVIFDPDPAIPKPRTEESRAASRRDFDDPLLNSYPSSTPPPRHAADAEPEVAASFDQVSLMIRDYHALTGENPIGTNAEIMKSIMGGNPKGAQLGPPEGQTLNEKGELIDRWGTPYFFHQLTKDLMEIHSAGPDRRMWNDDDLITR